MRSLTDLIEFINEHYPQSWIEQNDIDLLTSQKSRRKYPRFLFRGEENIGWDTTCSAYSRQQGKIHPLWSEYDCWISGRYPVPEFNNVYSLYFFLRDVIWNISAFDNSLEASRCDQQIAAIMQHYGFPSSLIDLTSDPAVAAHFALGEKKPGQIGQIMVLPTSKFEYMTFDLSFDSKSRPDRQKGFALLLPPQLDLKSEDFRVTYECEWFCFELTNQDVITFLNPALLSTEGDPIVRHITDWYNAHILGKNNLSPALASLLSQKVSQLRGIY